jgi:hypothetical protein
VAQHDPTVAQQFLRVIGFLDPPTALFRPGILGRVLLRGRRSVEPTLASARPAAEGPPVLLR